MATMQYHNLTEALQGESAFGLAANGKRFDFTLLFEQSILTIAPSALLLLALPIRLVQLIGERRKVFHGHRAFSKMAAYVILAALQLALIVQWAKIQGDSSAQRASVAASSLGLIDALALCILSYMEHIRSVRPSNIICAYLFFSILFDATQCRTLWLLGITQTTAALYTTMLATKVAIFGLEVHEKRTILFEYFRSLGPESTSGIMSRGLFWWLNSLMMKGFSASLSLSSLYNVDEQLQSKPLLQRAQEEWSKRKNTGKHALFMSVVCCIKGPLTQAVFPRLCLTGFKFAQPFLVKRMINYVEESPEYRSKDIGYGLIAATGLIYAGTAFATGFYQHKLYRVLTMVRGTIVALVLSHTLELDSSTTAGSATLTHITADVGRISSAFESFHEIWANIMEIGLAIWLLQRQLGVGCVGPAIVVLACTLLMSRLSVYMGPAVKVWNAAVQKRVSVTASILSSMKEVKMLGMVHSWTKAIDALRIQEMAYSAKYRTFITYMNLLGNAPAKLAPVATFGIALLAQGHGLHSQFNTGTAFASLSIMGLIVGPLAMLLTSVPSFVSSLGCFERLQSFLDDDNTIQRTSDSSRDPEPTTQPGDVTDIQLDILRRGSVEDSAITARHASFGVNAVDMILRDINIEIEPRSLTIVTGKVGCGKTTLLRGLLGELHSQGYFKISATGVAYCAQTTWLVNSTIRRNILGQSDLDNTWYNAVIEACALDRDLVQLPAGDLSLIGSKGITLSGGQKQRVSLARAIYSRKSVMLIDDILSGLDWTTRSHVWNRVFGPTGLLCQQGVTVLLATHTLNYLQNTDSVILLTDDGQIGAQGTFGSLKNNAQISVLHIDSEDASENSDNQSIVDVENPSKVAEAKPEAAKDEMTALMDRSGEKSLYSYYFKSFGWRFGLVAIFLHVSVATADVLPGIWMRFWTDANRAANSTHGHVNTGRYFGIYVIISTISLIVIGIKIWWSFVKIIPKSATYLHFKMLQTVMNAPLSFFTSTDTGDLVNRFSKDMSLVDSDLPTDMHVTCSNFFSTIAESILVILGASYLGSLIPFAIVFLYGLQKFYLRTSRQLRFLDLQATAPLHTHLLETIDGLTTIRAFGWKSATHQTSMTLLDDSQKPHYLLYCVQRWLTLVLDLFVAVSAAILVTFGVVLPHTTSVGAMALALTSLLGLSESLAGLISSWTGLETSLGSVSRLKRFEIDTPREIPPAHPEEPPALWPSRGKLQIDGMTASYSSDPDVEPALKKVSLDIQSGEKVALCGRTGSGKSSLLLTLFRLLEPNDGTITLDGIDISQIEQNNLRRRLIAVPQEAMLFPGTLRSNISPNENGSQTPSDERMMMALEQVELWDAIALRGGLDTDVDNLALSHGQKQLLCLARAVLRKESSAIIILDEAMSAVDDHTEEVMVRILEKEFVNHTVISVVHRLNTVLDFDKVVLLENGCVVEAGKPADLLERREGKFRALWEGRSG